MSQSIQRILACDSEDEQFELLIEFEQDLFDKVTKIDPSELQKIVDEILLPQFPNNAPMLWQLVLNCEPSEKIANFAKWLLESDSNAKNLADATAYLRLKFPNVFQTMIETIKTSADPDVQFEIGLQIGERDRVAGLLYSIPFATKISSTNRETFEFDLINYGTNTHVEAIKEQMKVGDSESKGYWQLLVGQLTSHLAN